MLIEQIIEFQLRGMGPLAVRTYTPRPYMSSRTGYFRDKTKFSKEIFEWIIIHS